MQFTLPFYRSDGTPVSGFSTSSIPSHYGFIEGESWLRKVPGCKFRDHGCAQHVHDSPCAVATRANQRWSIDFGSDYVSKGRAIRMFTVVDDCTRECSAIEVDTSLGGLRVRRVLDRIASDRGLPEAIVLDNGPEFRGRALAAWSEERGVRHLRQ